MSQLEHAINLVRGYLDAMIARDIETASHFIHPEATITYPGGKVYKAISTLSEASSTKFKTLSKEFHRIEGFTNVLGVHVVFVSGILNGTWPDDSSFKGIRFIDRYEVKEAKIHTQEVWSDSAEFRILKILNK